MSGLRLTMAGLILATAGGIASAGAVVPGFNSSTLPENDDGSTGLVGIGFSANFFGTTYTDLYVNNNGNVTFDAPLATFTPFGLNATSRVIIAPFFADVDTRLPAGQEVTYGTGVYSGQSAFGVNWVDVDYYSGSHPDQLNSFQLLLVNRADVNPGDFDIYFNYDKILWETGNASGGTGGLGGNSATVGYSNGAGSSYQQVGSAVNGAFLDGGPNSLVGLPNSQLYFQVRNGEVIQPPSSVPEPSTMLLCGIGAAFTVGGAYRRRRMATAK